MRPNSFESLDEILKCDPVQKKATEQCFFVVLFIILYKVVLTFESVEEIPKCNHSNESYWAVLSCGTVYYDVQGCSNFRVCKLMKVQLHHLYKTTDLLWNFENQLKPYWQRGYISFLLDWLGTPHIGRAAHANHVTVDVKNTWFVPVSLTFGFGT